MFLLYIIYQKKSPSFTVHNPGFYPFCLCPFSRNPSSCCVHFIGYILLLSCLYCLQRFLLLLRLLYCLLAFPNVLWCRMKLRTVRQCFASAACILSFNHISISIEDSLKLAFITYQQKDESVFFSSHPAIYCLHFKFLLFSL